MTDLADRRSRHLETARRFAISLKERGVEMRLVGSLAQGADSDTSSDIEFLVLECPDYASTKRDSCEWRREPAKRQRNRYEVRLSQATGREKSLGLAQFISGRKSRTDRHGCQLSFHTLSCLPRCDATGMSSIGPQQ